MSFYFEHRLHTTVLLANTDCTDYTDLEISVRSVISVFVKLLKSVFERLLHEVALAFQFFLNILQGGDFGLGFLKVQHSCVI